MNIVLRKFNDIAEAVAFAKNVSWSVYLKLQKSNLVTVTQPGTPMDGPWVSTFQMGDIEIDIFEEIEEEEWWVHAQCDLDQCSLEAYEACVNALREAQV